MDEARPAELYRLAEVMHRLRTGCPWDASQTHSSLVGYLVEETLEVVEAIEAGTDADLAEELGDLLLQVFFHSEIAAETGRFSVEDVAGRIADKLVARHPYVFADGPAGSGRRRGRDRAGPARPGGPRPRARSRPGAGRPRVPADTGGTGPGDRVRSLTAHSPVAG